MDKKLFDRINSSLPKFNPVVAGGLVVSQLTGVEQYIDRVIRCAEGDFPKTLRYLGYARCTPTEEYAVITAKRTIGPTLELSKSDVYLVKYFFEFEGVALKPRYLYLPYCREAGVISIMGSIFSISPILTDHSISVGKDKLFIPLNKTKLHFAKLTYAFKAHGRLEHTYVIWSEIHAATKQKAPAGQRRSGVCKTTNFHYLCCKYGLYKTFSEFGRARVVVGLNEINDENYPADKWVICTSAGTRPRGMDARMKPTNVRLAIQADQYNLTTASMIGTFFYILDHYPDRVQVEHIDDVTAWRTLLGSCIWPGTESYGKLLQNVNIHIASIDGYIDAMVKEWLAEDGIFVENIYELLQHVVETFPYRITNTMNDAATMYDKRLTVLRYLLSDLINNIFHMQFEVQKASHKGLTANTVNTIMNKWLRHRLIFGINRQHAEVSGVQSPTDCIIHRLTSGIVLQSRASSNVRSNGGSATFDASKILHSSMAEVAQYNNLPKSEPTGRSKVNPFLHIGGDGAIEKNPELLELIESTQRYIQR